MKSSSHHSHLLAVASTVTLLSMLLLPVFMAGGQDDGAINNQFLERKGDFFRITQETTYIDRGEAEGIMCNVYESALDSASVSPKNLIYHGAQYVTGSDIFYLQNVTKEKTVVDVKTIKRTKISANGTEEVDYDVIRTERKVNVTEEEWVRDMPAMSPGNCIRVKFVTYMKPMLGDRRVEYVPELLGMKYEEYGWFNLSYMFRRPIYARCTSCGSELTNLTFLVNDSAFYLNATPQYVWINALLNSSSRVVAWIYYNKSEEGIYEFTDETDTKAIPFDVDTGSRSGHYSPWPQGSPQYYEDVYHFADVNLNNSANLSQKATLAGGATLKNGWIVNSTETNASGQYVSLAFDPYLSLYGGQNYTMSFWFKSYIGPDSNAHCIIGDNPAGAGCDDHAVWISANTGTLQCAPYAADTFVSTSGYADGNWHHVVCGTANVTGGSSYNAVFFVDGINVSGATNSRTYNRYHGFQISGRDSTSQRFQGIVDEVRIEKRAMSAAEAIFMYNNTVGNQNMSWLGPEEDDIFWITFHIYDSITQEGIGGSTNIYCNNSYSSSTYDGGADNFSWGTYMCTFSDADVPIEYYDKNVTFMADEDKTVNVSMSPKLGLTDEEHNWLEAIYKCLYVGDCPAMNLLLDINETVHNFTCQ